MKFEGEGFIQIVGALLLGLFFLILSSLGVFDLLLDKSEKLQSGYRSQIDHQINGINDNLSVFKDLSSLKKQRDEYQYSLINSQNEVAKLKKQIEEYDLLQKQTDSFFRPDFQLQPARIIRYDRYASGEFIVNRGLDDGIKQGDVVIFLNYAIGEVVSVNKTNSTVRSIYSNKSKIAVRDEDGVRGVLVFDNKKGLIVEKISNEYSIKTGNEFYTYGVNSNFPEGLSIGKSDSKLSEIVDTSQTVSISNPISLEKLSEVFIIINEK